MEQIALDVIKKVRQDPLVRELLAEEGRFVRRMGWRREDGNWTLLFYGFQKPEIFPQQEKLENFKEEVQPHYLKLTSFEQYFPKRFESNGHQDKPLKSRQIILDDYFG